MSSRKQSKSHKQLKKKKKEKKKAKSTCSRQKHISNSSMQYVATLARLRLRDAVRTRLDDGEDVRVAVSPRCLLVGGITPRTPSAPSSKRR